MEQKAPNLPRQKGICQVFSFYKRRTFHAIQFISWEQEWTAPSDLALYVLLSEKSAMETAEAAPFAQSQDIISQKRKKFFPYLFSFPF